MKGDKVLRALEIVKDIAIAEGDFICAFLSSGYGASGRKINWKIRQIQWRREMQRRENAPIEAEFRSFYNLKYYLKKEGLIECGTRGDSKCVTITKKGLWCYEKLTARKQVALPNKEYNASSENLLTVIAFDVPEKERRKRDWLRTVLAKMRFEPVQKSVWIGRRGITKEFLNDLGNLRLAKCVEIFQVTKSGSLHHLKAK